MRDRREHTGASYLKRNVFNDGGYLLCRKLERERESWSFARVTKRLLRTACINFNYNTVELVVLLLAERAFPFFPECENFFYTLGFQAMRIYREAERAQVFQFLMLTFRKRTLDRINVVQKHTERTCRGDSRVELAHRTCGNVTRIYKERLPCLLLGFI